MKDYNWANFFEKSLLEDNNDWYSFLDHEELERFVGNSVWFKKQKVGPRGKGIFYSPVLLDVEHKYEFNSHGYRSPEFTKSEIVAGGCSQTFGVGVAQEMIWPYQLSRSTGMECANIAQPGASVQWIVQKMFAYFKEFGNPKAVVCVFPDFYRMVFPVNQNLITFAKKPVNSEAKVPNIHLEGRFDLSNRPKYSRVPHHIDDVVPVELPFYISCQYIHMLEQYCRSNGIKLAWTTWKFPLNELIKELSSKFDIFNNYLEVDQNRWIDTGNQDIFCKNYVDAVRHNKNAEEEMCHIELEEEYSHCFLKGADYEASPDWRHMGIHRHIHFAEAFYNFINDGAVQ